MDADERTQIDELLKISRRRLNGLQSQTTFYAISAPPEVEVEIEDLRKHISKLEKQLAQTQPTTTKATRFSSLPTASPPPPPPSEREAAIQLLLRIEPDKGTAQVTWEASILGQLTSTFIPPYRLAKIPLVLKALAAQQRTMSSETFHFDQGERNQLKRMDLWDGNWVANDVYRRIGRSLYKALIRDSRGRTAWNTIGDYATAQGLQLDLVLRFPRNAIEFAALPWELLWDEHQALLLSRGRLSSCIRYLDLGPSLPPPKVAHETLQVLMVAPYARIPEKQRAEEQQARRRAFAELEQAGVVRLEEYSPATVGGLVDRLQSGPPVDILHFYGHSRYQNNQAALLFDTISGDETWVDADRFVVLLGAVPLLLLHSAQSGLFDDEDLPTGVGPALSAAGIHTVVALQLPLRLQIGLRFATIVYRELARGMAVQRAVSQARQALYVEEEDGISWYVPTLTIRSRYAELRFLVQK